MYEFLILVSQPEANQYTRIAADVWIKQLFSVFGYDTLSITLLLVGVLGLLIFYFERNRLPSIRGGYFLGMLLEAGFYAILIAFLISSSLSNPPQLIIQEPLAHLTGLQQIALSLGAGLYEELFFRVILVGVLIKILNWIFDKYWISALSAALLAAMVFSMAHFTGALGNPFTVHSFFFRFLFGLVLNAIYVLRGFGLAAWTHAVYDIMVIAYI